MAIGDRLRNAMTLWGAPGCINTGKCLMTAGEKGLDIKTASFDPGSSEVQSMSPLGIGPIVRHVDYVVVGHVAIMSYFDDKGFGPSLIIRNGVVRSAQYQWSHYAMDVVQENMDNNDVLEKCFSELNKHLQNRSPAMRGDFICGEFSLADIHWAACANMLIIQGKSNLVEKHGEISEWWRNVQAHPSTSKESLHPFTCLPTKQDVDSNTLRDITLNVG